MTDPIDELPEDRHRGITRRTRICIWIIIIGLVNFLAYTLAYLYLGGDAMNGRIEYETVAGQRVLHHYLIAHGDRIEVARGVWVYSAVHSVSIWITVGAVLLAMLTLAKDRIVSSLRSTIIRGRTFITIVATVVTLITVMVTTWFVIYMISHLVDPRPATPP